jgi:L-cysteate sulfo-lyase
MSKKNLKDIPRIKLGHFPTPIEHLKNISNFLGGPQIYIKRDDCSGLATGGNKVRKLEFLMADALEKKAELVVTIGAVQSNHARQTAAAATLLGVKCLIILEHRIDNPPEEYLNSGNVFLDKIFGAKIEHCPKDRDVKEYAAERIKEIKQSGTNVYFIPGGGSNPIGALGYVECINEIIHDKQNLSFNNLVHGTGSSGTQAGLLAGKRYFDYKVPVTGISGRFKKDIKEEKVYTEAKATCEFLGCDVLDKKEVVAFDEYVGPGYGLPTDAMIEATDLLAKKEAILLDPVYSGKGFAGLIDLVKKNYFSKTDKVLFIHTGGAVSLFAYEWAFKNKLVS